MKTGDVIRIKAPAQVAGLMATIVRRSRATGGLTVKLIQARGAYQVGAELNVAPYEVEPATIVR